jgi:hypothetical protein
MSFSDWIRQFRALHAEAVKGSLTPAELETYRSACDEFARALMGAQRIALKPGEVPRQTLRIARAVQVELESPLIQARVSTIDLGVGGFSATLAKAPKIGDEMDCKMKLPGGDPVETTVHVIELKPAPGSVRVSFSFKKLGDASKARLEALVIESALAQIAT